MTYTVINYPHFIDKVSETLCGHRAFPRSYSQAVEDLDSTQVVWLQDHYTYTLLSCKISKNFKALSSAQEGRSLESVPGFPQYPRHYLCNVWVWLVIYHCVVPSFGTGNEENTCISVVGYRGKHIKGKSKSWATHMQDSFSENMSLSICVFLLPKIIHSFLLRRKNHNPLCIWRQLFSSYSLVFSPEQTCLIFPHGEVGSYCG